MNALIVGGAPVTGADAFYRSLIMAADTVVAADRGGLLCVSAGRSPDLWVGDFDSVPPEVPEQAEREGIAVLRYPPAKDASDLDLALDATRRLTPASVTFTAAFSDRLDHTLAGIGTLLRAVDLHAWAAEPSFSMYPLDAKSRPVITLAETPGTTVSLFALDPGTVASIDGVRFPLQAEELRPLSSRGLSNVATSRQQRVAVVAGRLLVVVIAT